MANQKFYEAVRRGKLPYPTHRDDARKGWPPLLYPWFLACAQLPDGDTIDREAFTLHMGDCIRAGALPAVRQRIPWFIENEVIEPHVTAPDFAAWLAREGVEPSPLVREWFAHEGAASPAPAPTQTAAAPAPVVASTSSEPAWTVTKPKRFTGYTAPLHRLLAAAHRDGKTRPTARDVMEAWRTEKPSEVAKVLTDGFDFYDANGNTKAANLEAIRKAIGRMTSAR